MRTNPRSQPSAFEPPASPDAHDVLARIELAFALIPAVVRQVKRDLALGMPDDELTSFGSEGALSAGRTFDPSHGVPFERWAALKIRGKVLDGLRTHAPLPRRSYQQLRALLAEHHTAEGIIEEDSVSSSESADAADLRLSSRLATLATAMALGTLFASDPEILDGIEDRGVTAEDEIIREELKARVRAAVAVRPERERDILERYYFQDMTLAEASRGLSRSWSSRLLARATEGVGKTLRATARASRDANDRDASGAGDPAPLPDAASPDDGEPALVHAARP
jgi:RNA polymerase sigma factor for flagellar operon FliA